MNERKKDKTIQKPPRQGEQKPKRGMADIEDASPGQGDNPRQQPTPERTPPQAPAEVERDQERPGSGQRTHGGERESFETGSRW